MNEFDLLITCLVGITFFCSVFAIMLIEHK